LLSDKRTHAKLARHMTASDEPERPRTTSVPARSASQITRERVGAQIKTQERSGGADGYFCIPAGNAGT
jgi:hypothetical protein